MKRYSGRLVVGLTALLVLGACFTETLGQQPSPPDSGPEVAAPTDPNRLDRPFLQTAEQSRAYREIDLLRRDGFAVAQAATVSLHMADKKGQVP
jgi:hypothetical protein